MSKSVGLKFIAMILTAACLVGVVVCGLGVIYVGEQGLYTQSPKEQKQERLEYIAEFVSIDLAQSYAVETYSPGDATWNENISGYDYNYYYTDQLVAEGEALYTILDETGKVLASTHDAATAADFLSYEIDYTPDFPVTVIAGSEADLKLQQSLGMTANTDETSEPTISVTWPSTEDDVETTLEEAAGFDVGSATFSYETYRYAGSVRYHLFFFHAPMVTVKLWLSPDAYGRIYDYYYESNELTGLLYPARYSLLVGLAVTLVLSLAGIVYLCWVSGRKKGTDEIRAVGLNRLPLDLYACVVGFGGFRLVYFCFWMTECGLFDGDAIQFWLLYLAAGVAFLTALVALVFIYGIAAQLKMKKGFWWKNTLVGRFLRWIWKYVKLLLRALVRLVSLIPLIWQWLLIAGVLVFFLVISVQEMRYDSGIPFLLCLTVTGAFIAYVAYAFGVLVEGAKRMAKGDLSKKVNTKYLFGFFRDSANDLNALADVAVVAAQKQLKSERMKTELITNVSHDIKTPLTSIINFVDLLEKPHTAEQEKEYLAVLDRQSQRLKKLIEDLMEMSKASTGNIQVNITAVDACEAVNQALGEFSDKLNAQRLIPVVRMPEGMVPMQADGRLVWRVLSNVLSNVVKYALPGTRVYIDVARLEDKVLISVKNISREELNVSAEELMERFVRGDASRNTEGSGLGLNIAKSLMDVQHGLMQLLVDGDLFKVTLIFPAE